MEATKEIVRPSGIVSLTNSGAITIDVSRKCGCVRSSRLTFKYNILYLGDGDDDCGDRVSYPYLSAEIGCINKF